MPKSADAGSGWAGAGGRGRSRGKRQWLGAGQLLPRASKGEGSLSKRSSDWSRTLSIKVRGMKIHGKQEQHKLSATTLHPAQISPNWSHWDHRHVGRPQSSARADTTSALPRKQLLVSIQNLTNPPPGMQARERSQPVQKSFLVAQTAKRGVGGF